jgi:hypothetical protein
MGETTPTRALFPGDLEQFFVVIVKRNPAVGAAGSSVGMGELGRGPVGGGLGKVRRVRRAKQKHDPYRRRNNSEGFHQVAILKQVTHMHPENVADRYDAGTVVNSDTWPRCAELFSGHGFDWVCRTG